MKSIFAYKKFGTLGTSVGAVVAAMGCAACFPAIASLGAVLGLGFLSQWEWVFINTWLPILAWVTLALNILGWFGHKQWLRTALGIVGPILLLISLYPWFQYAWSIYVTYPALAFMVLVAIGDFIYPANVRCDDKNCAI